VHAPARGPGTGTSAITGSPPRPRWLAIARGERLSTPGQIRSSSSSDELLNGAETHRRCRIPAARYWADPASLPANLRNDPLACGVRDVGLLDHDELGLTDGESLSGFVGGVEPDLSEMSPQSPAHALLIERLMRHFARAEAWRRVHFPLEAAGNSVPEPDLALVEHESSAEHPRGALVVGEIAVSSQAVDRGQEASSRCREHGPVLVGRRGSAVG
jgi:hypothetical protein